MLVAGNPGRSDRKSQQLVPLLLVGRSASQPLVDATARGEEVLVEFRFGQPAAVAVVDVWLPISDMGKDFLCQMAPTALELGERLHVRVHFRIVAAPEDTSHTLSTRHCYAGLRELCADVSGPWATAPPGAWRLREAAHQHCLLRGFPQSVWWRYVQVANCTGSWTCTRRALAEIGLLPSAAATVRRCASAEAASFLEDGIDDLALRINGWRQSGPIQARRLLRTVCWQLSPAPSVCKRILHEEPESGQGRSQPVASRFGSWEKDGQGLPFWRLAGLCALSVATGWALRAPVAWSLRRLLRRAGHACKLA